jgi:hypothetical protein
MMKGFMKYAVEVGSNAMIYISSFIKIGSAVQTSMDGANTKAYRHGDLTSLLLFSSE